jgi:elongation factor P
MSQTEQLRKGMVIRHEGHLFTVTDFQVAQAGKQKPTVHVKLRSLKDGKQAERTLDQLGELDEVPSEMREMQYLYASGRERVFMDLTTYDQFTLSDDLLGHGRDFLVEEQAYRFLTVDGQPVSLQLPPSLPVEIADTAPPAHGGGSGAVMKEARLASGRTVMVPLFIKVGDKIRVSTADGTYQGKEH